eukprot:6203301-Pleurochrysis_carterae.AAC.5
MPLSRIDELTFNRGQQQHFGYDLMLNNFCLTPQALGADLTKCRILNCACIPSSFHSGTGSRHGKLTIIAICFK